MRAFLIMCLSSFLWFGCHTKQYPNYPNIEPINDAPSDLRALFIDQTTLVLFWQDNAEEEIGFRLQYAQADSQWLPLRDEGPEVEGAGIFDLDSGTIYHFRVSALFLEGADTVLSAWSNVITVSMPS